jgi:hypothetical protein
MFKSRILAAAATLTLVSALGLAGAGTASAATPSCGSHCIDIFSQQFANSGNPTYVLDTLKQGLKVGQPLILFRTANYDPAEDFTVAYEGRVSDFYTAGLVSAAVDLHYGCSFDVATNTCGDTSFPDDYAFEGEYAPFGVDSGLCAGVAATAFQGEGVTLQPCGTSSRTVWIADLALKPGQQADSCPSNPLYLAEIPLINGSDGNFSQPFVLTYPANGYPTNTPRPQLQVDNLTGFSQSGDALPCGGNSIVGPDSSQLWSATEGVLP